MDKNTRAQIKELATPENKAAYQKTEDQWIFADDLLIDSELDARTDECAARTVEHDKRVEFLESLLATL